MSPFYFQILKHGTSLNLFSGKSSAHEQKIWKMDWNVKENFGGKKWDSFSWPVWSSHREEKTPLQMSKCHIKLRQKIMTKCDKSIPYVTNDENGEKWQVSHFDEWECENDYWRFQTKDWRALDRSLTWLGVRQKTVLRLARRQAGSDRVRGSQGGQIFRGEVWTACQTDSQTGLGPLLSYIPQVSHRPGDKDSWFVEHWRVIRDQATSLQ